MSKIKLNVGAIPIWKNDDWHILDHKNSSDLINSNDFTLSKNNYNRYGYSLLFDEEIRNKLDKMGIEYKNPINE